MGIGLLATNPLWLASVLALVGLVLVGLAGPMTLLALVVAFTGVSLNFLANIQQDLGKLDVIRVLLVFGGCGMLMLRERAQVAAECRRVSLYVVLLVFAIASLSWSPSPIDGLWFFSRLAYPFLTFILVRLVLARHGERAIISLLVLGSWVATVVNLSVSVVGLSSFTGPGYEGRYAGSLHPNSLGLFCVISALIMYGLWSHYRRNGFAIVVGILLVQAVATGSRTAMIAGGSAFMVFDLLRKRALRTAGWLVVGLCLWVAIPTLGQRTSEAVDSGAGSSQFLSGVNLSGRSMLWADVYAAMMGDQMLLGRGLGATEAFFKTRYTSVRSVHNGYVQVSVDLGVVGLILLLGFLVLMGIDAGRHRESRRARPPYPELTIALLVGLLLTSAMESTFAGYAFPMTLLWIMYALSISNGSVPRRYDSA